MRDVLTNLIVVNISKYIHISNHHVVHLKLTVLYVNYISIKLGKKHTNCTIVIQYLSRNWVKNSKLTCFQRENTNIYHNPLLKLLYISHLDSPPVLSNHTYPPRAFPGPHQKYLPTLNLVFTYCSTYYFISCFKIICVHVYNFLCHTENKTNL